MRVRAEYVALRFGAGTYACDEESVDCEGREGEIGEVLACDVDVGKEGEERDFLVGQQ